MKERRLAARLLGLATIVALGANLALLAVPDWILDLIAPPAVAANAAPPAPAREKSTEKPEEPEEPEEKEAAEEEIAEDGEDEKSSEEPDEGKDSQEKQEGAEEKSDSPDETNEPAKPEEAKPSGAPGPPASSTGKKPDGSNAARESLDPASERMFRRIVSATESMEPENAATLLIELAGADQDAAVRTLLAMNPRKAGGVLDAMSLKNTGVAARLTREMIRRSTR